MKIITERLLMIGFFILFSDFSQEIYADEIRYVEGEVLVRYLSSISPEAKEFSLASIGAKAEPLGHQVLVSNLELLHLDAGESVERAVRELEQRPGVLYASPNYVVSIGAGMFPPRDFPNRPNPDPRFSDPYFYRSYGIKLIGALKSWNAFTLGSHDVIVGVVDTGIDYSHEDLASNIWKNSREIPNNALDDDGNGYIDDVYGWNFVNNSNNPFDDNQHGTHVAGTIGAVNGNNVGTIGVSPKVSLMACKFLNKDGEGTLSTAIQAVSYAVSNGAKVLNNSWGGKGFSQALLDTIKEVERRGVLFVAAAGNWNENNDKKPVYPASFDATNIIAVTATDRRDEKASFSNYGKISVDLGAPGVEVYSTFPYHRYGNLDGTSMSTPHVSGAAALILAYKPVLSLYDLKNLILSTVDSSDSMKNITVTGGRVNVYNAMALGFLSF